MAVIDPVETAVRSGARRLGMDVYLPRSQPNHEQFPLDWSAAGTAAHAAPLARAVFVAARHLVANDALASALLEHQTRHA